MRKEIGRFPGDTQPEFIHLVGTIVTWWARIEGLMVMDLLWLRRQPFGKHIAEKDTFPNITKRIVKQWAKLLRAGHAGDDEKLKQLNEIQAEALEAVQHRNAISHCFWPYGQSKEDEITLSSIRPVQGDPSNIQFVHYVYTLEHLDDVNEQLCTLYHRVMVFSLNSHRLQQGLARKWMEL